MTAGDYLALIAEVAVGVAGFSGIVAALTRRSSEEWRAIDVVRLQVLLFVSISVVTWALLPALLLSSGIEGPSLWRFTSGAWLLVTTPLVYSRVRKVVAVISENSQDTSTALSVYVAALLFATFALQVANVVSVAAPWPHLGCLTLDLLLTLALFLRLATVAFAPTRPAA